MKKEGLKENILKLREKGYSYNKIVEELNCAKSTVSYHCSKNEIKHYKFDGFEKIQKLYDEIGNYKKVAEELNLSKSFVRKHIKIKKIKKDPLERKKDVSNNVMNWRKRVKIKLVEYKGGKCLNCEYNKSIRSLTFHHLNPEEKDFGISGKSYSFERMKKEVDKCILLCANCHNEVHDEIEQNGFSEIVNNIAP